MKRNGKNRKIRMGAVALLTVAVLAGCGKKPEAVKEEMAENIEKKTEEISGEEITEPAAEETAELPDAGTAESDGLGFCRVPNRSAWDGTYYREDGAYITVYDTDEDYLFLSYPESFDERMVDILQFTDAGKTQAVSATQDITAVYALSGDVLSIDFGTAYVPYMQGIYYRKKDASCWRTEADGTERYLDETGKILRNHMTPDGWYADGDGRKLWEIGMLQITPGLYESMPAYSEREDYETWSFSMYSGAEDSGFFNSPDQRLEVGTVDYTVYDQEMNPYYTKEAMYVYNSPDGYVIEDVSGQEFAWFYPSIHWNDLMIQMYGTEAYHTVRMIENYADYGG
ncbi:hypothetical protein ACTNCH_09155 [Candidatus Merdisoma sp. HCP28S3_D10]|uniref:hypothetical protein n=1 Tax=unclassified Candidatus Merdisoma TaxID=3099611 RepID=UPI003F8B23D9